MSSLHILAGGRGLKAGEELTFFYPSTEWDMDQGFNCFCGSENCLGYIGGAKHMTPAQLEGRWINAHIRELLEDRENSTKNDSSFITHGNNIAGNPTATNGPPRKEDATEAALFASLTQARKMVEAAQKALDTYVSIHSERENGVGSRELSGEMGGDTRRGVTSRELSGEMGGDTVAV